MTQLLTRNGFSLVETMASITLFGIIAATLATTTVGTIRANIRSNDISAASALVHDRIEAFRSLDPTSADLTPGTHTDARNPLTAHGQTTATCS